MFTLPVYIPIFSHISSGLTSLYLFRTEIWSTVSKEDLCYPLQERSWISCPGDPTVASIHQDPRPREPAAPCCRLPLHWRPLGSGCKPGGSDRESHVDHRAELSPGFQIKVFGLQGGVVYGTVSDRCEDPNQGGRLKADLTGSLQGLGSR